MKAMIVQKPAGFDQIKVQEQADITAPSVGEIQVEIHANSLNFHDLLVARGDFPTDWLQEGISLLMMVVFYFLMLLALSLQSVKV